MNEDSDAAYWAEEDPQEEVGIVWLIALLLLMIVGGVVTPYFPSLREH